MHGFNGLGAVKGTFRATSGMQSNPSAEESIDATKLACDKGVALKNEYAKNKIILNDGDSTWITLLEDFGAHMEVPLRYDATDKDVVEKIAEWADRSNKGITDWKLGIGEFECGFYGARQLHEYAGPKTMNYHVWVGRIKTLLDPNLVGSAATYPSPIEVEL